MNEESLMQYFTDTDMGLDLGLVNMSCGIGIF